jgi:hypothetical protein
VLVEEDEVGVRAVADPCQGVHIECTRDREFGHEGGGRGGVASRVDLHDLGAELSFVDDGVFERLKEGCAGGLGIFRGGELKGAGEL